MPEYRIQVLAVYEQTIYVEASTEQEAREIYEEGGGLYEAELEFIEELPERLGVRVIVTETDRGA